MFKISVENFRSFECGAVFEIRPLTIFVGRNSSGKSTITRLIPLLQQTFEQRTSAPLLWNGALVDFGSFEEVRPKWKQDVEGSDIVIGFEADAPINTKNRWGVSEVRGRKKYNTTIKYEAYVSGSKSGTNLSSFRLRVGSDNIYVKISKNKKIEEIYVNDYILNDFSYQNFSISNESLFPSVYYYGDSDGDIYFRRPVFEGVEAKLMEVMGDFFHGSTSKDKRQLVIDSINYAQPDVFKEELQKLSGATAFFKRKVMERPETVERVRVLKFISAFPDFLDYSSSLFRSRFSASAYIGPSRAAGERYYRWQDLAVDRLDPKGENLAMYLMSLGEADLKVLNRILSNSLGFHIRRRRLTGHASIMISENNSENWHNIADLGFGYSQILPVVAQIHSMMRQKGFPFFLGPHLGNNRLVAIEQPELHLHPALQGRLAKLFENAIYVSEDRGPSRELSGLNIVAETHSEIFLNRVGEEVEKGSIHRDDVVVYVFDKPDVDGPTRVMRSEFQENGSLSNWPFGFFNDDY